MVPSIDQDGLHFDFLCWRILYFLNHSFVFSTIYISFVFREGFGLWLFRDLLFSLLE
jgi:hypothetical protein